MQINANGRLATRAMAILLALTFGANDGLAEESDEDDADFGFSLETRYGHSVISLGGKSPQLRMTLYGQLNQAALYFDDGRDSGTYFVDNNASSLRFGLTGNLRFSNDWSMGSRFEAGVDVPGTSTVRAGEGSRTRPSIEGDDRIFMRDAAGWIEGPIGRVTVGQTFPVIGNWIPNPGRTYATDQASFFLIGGAFNPVISKPLGSRVRLIRPWSAYAAPMQWSLIDPVFLVRFDSPSIADITFSSAYSPDGVYDVGVRYAGKVARLAIDASFAFHSNQKSENDRGQPGFPEFEECFVGGVGLRDTLSGLFGVIGGNYRMFDGSDPNDFRGDGELRPNDFGLWGQFGLRRDIFGIGDTVIYGVFGYGHDRGKGRSVPGTAGSTWLRTRVLMSGINVIQELDVAKKIGTRLEIYFGYRQWNGDFLRTTSASDHTPFKEDVETLHIITSGLRLRF